MTYADKVADQNLISTSPSRACDLGKILEFFDDMDDDRGLDIFFEQAADLLPPELNIVAKTLCPSGELLIAALNVLPPRKFTSNVVCIFPEKLDGIDNESYDNHYSVTSSPFYKKVAQTMMKMINKT